MRFSAYRKHRSKAEVQLLCPGQGRAPQSKTLPLALLHCVSPVLIGLKVDSFLYSNMGTSARQGLSAFLVSINRQCPLSQVYERRLRERDKARQTGYFTMSSGMLLRTSWEVVEDGKEDREGGAGWREH